MGIALAYVPGLIAAQGAPGVPTGDTSPALVAIAVAFVALLGVLISQFITLHNEQARRRAEQAATVRKDVQALMMVFFEFAEFSRSNYSPKRASQACDDFDEQWDNVSGPLAAMAANMAGRGRHRDAALTLMDGIGLQAGAYKKGESIGIVPRVGYVQMAWAGFEVVAAWLRGEGIPRHARGVVKSARVMRSHLEKEQLHREREEDPDYKSGVVRVAARRGRRWVVSHVNGKLLVPIGKLWRFLFAA
jgi:hypothetical protein